jgi:signal transduction histidine kinase
VVRIAKKHVEVHISDQGPGINPEEINRLLDLNFDETSTFTQRIRSSGLGLRMAKRIIDLHFGKLWIESDGKNGTTVSFSLPIEE